eukprot:6735067-Pyramimonas_sp.AAC.1
MLLRPAPLARRTARPRGHVPRERVHQNTPPTGATTSGTAIGASGTGAIASTVGSTSRSTTT